MIKCYHITTGWNTAMSAKQEGVWGIMSVFRHYSMSKPQRQCAAKDSSILTTFLWLSSQTKINEKLQIQEEAFNARTEKLKKAWGLQTRRVMLNFTETNKTSQNNRLSRAPDRLHLAGRGKASPNFYYPNELEKYWPQSCYLLSHKSLWVYYTVCYKNILYIRVWRIIIKMQWLLQYSFDILTSKC